VWLDNHSLMLEQHLTGENYTKDFLSFICRMLELAPSSATLQIISEVFFKICALSGEVGSLLEIFHKHLMLVNADILERYVLSDPKRTFGLLFHQQAKVREFASSYLDRVLMLCYEREETAVKEKVVRFIQEYLNNLQGEVAKNWLRIDGYFKLFEKLVESSLAFPELYVMFVGSDLIAYLIDFIMERQSPLNIYQKKYSLGTKSNPVSFASGLNIILFLLKRVRILLYSRLA
jgi:ubiquitin carboxyl-terminal hydrolase 34